VKKYESEIRVLDGIGLSSLQIDSVQALLMMHVQSTSRSRIAYQRAQQTDGLTETEWWTTTVPLLQRVMTGEYPTAGRIGKEAGQAMAQSESSADHLFEFGLEMICQAVDAMIRAAQEA
jgi:hypothetical protein